MDSVVRGHHIYKRVCTPAIGEKLAIMAEDDNSSDARAVAVCKNGDVVGHLPRESAKSSRKGV